MAGVGAAAAAAVDSVRQAPVARQAHVHRHRQRGERRRAGAAFGAGAVEVGRHRQQVGDGGGAIHVDLEAQGVRADVLEAGRRLSCGRAFGLEGGIDDLAQLAQVIGAGVDLQQLAAAAQDAGEFGVPAWAPNCWAA